MLESKNKTLESQLKNGELREKALEKDRELNIVQLQAQIADNGVSVKSYSRNHKIQYIKILLNQAKFAVLMEKSKTLEKQLQNVEWHKTALEKVCIVIFIINKLQLQHSRKWKKRTNKWHNLL
jgi:hypothetical protein